MRRVDVVAPGMNELLFADIPQSATHLKLTFRGELAGGSPTRILRVQFNGDGGTNYNGTAWWHDGADQSQMLPLVRELIAEL